MPRNRPTIRHNESVTKAHSHSKQKPARSTLITLAKAQRTEVRVVERSQSRRQKNSTPSKHVREQINQSRMKNWGLKRVKVNWRSASSNPTSHLPRTTLQSIASLTSQTWMKVLIVIWAIRFSILSMQASLRRVDGASIGSWRTRKNSNWRKIRRSLNFKWRS